MFWVNFLTITVIGLTFLSWLAHIMSKTIGRVNERNLEKYERDHKFWEEQKNPYAKEPQKPLPASNPVIGAELFIRLKWVFSSLLILLILFHATFVEIGAQEIGVVITPKGVSSEEIYTGWHFLPFWYKIRTLDKTEQVYSFTSNVDEGQKKAVDAIWVATAAGIKMGFDFSMNWQIYENQADWIFVNLQDKNAPDQYDWIEEFIIRPIAKSALPKIIARYSPIEVYAAKRDIIQDEIYNTIREALKTKRIYLKRVDLREIYYPKEYENALNQKTLAEQEAIRLKDVTRQREELLKQEKIQKDIAITKAQGESEALKIKGQSITNNPKIIELEWINKWDGVLPNYMMGGNTSVLLQPNLK